MTGIMSYLRKLRKTVIPSTDEEGITSRNKLNNQKFHTVDIGAGTKTGKLFPERLSFPYGDVKHRTVESGNVKVSLKEDQDIVNYVKLIEYIQTKERARTYLLPSTFSDVKNN